MSMLIDASKSCNYFSFVDSTHEPVMQPNKSICKIGYRSGLVAFFATVAFTIAQLMQLFGWLTFPLDAILIYGFSFCIVVPFLLEMLALHYVGPASKKFWSHAAVIFSVIYAVFVTANYVVQLATVIPMTLQGAADEIKLLNQTPHSMFWDYDAIGYCFMGLATLVAVPVFEKQGFQKWVRGFLIANALVTPLIAFVYFYPVFSEQLLLFGLPWSITAPGAMLMIALSFKESYHSY